MKQFLAIALGLMLLATPLRAADVDGKWAGMFESPMGTIPIAFTFKADGATLTGTTGPEGMEVPIKDGKVDGANIAFAVEIDFGGMPLVLNYKGVVAGDEIKLVMEVMGMPFEFSVKKAK